MKKKNTMIISLFLCLVIMSTSTQAANIMKNEVEGEVLFIDEDIALTVGLLFVAESLKESSWKTTTQIRRIVPLYDTLDNIAHYYIELFTDESKSYVIVSTDMEGPLITEFSDNGELFVETNDNARNPISELSEGQKIYYNAFRCSLHPIDEEVKCDISKEEAKAFRQNAEKCIYFIRKNHITLKQAGCYYGFIDDPVVFIQNAFSYYSIGYCSEHLILNYSVIPNYSIQLNDGCFVYATAAILKYYLSDSYAYLLIVCRHVAQSQGYATVINGEWNYYIDNLDTVPYVNDCLSAVGLNKSASYALLSAAKNEIDNNRPCLLNIGYYASVHVDHTVTAIGYRTYHLTGSGATMDVTFYRVKDGDCSGDRFLYSAQIFGVYVTKVA